MTDETGEQPNSLLPYEHWAEEAMRHVMLRALAHVAREGLPGGHHIYLSFRTDDPGTVVPERVRAQYPQEMTIVLQHQYWDLEVNEATRMISVGLSFGGIGTMLRIPFGAVTQYFDPYVRYGLRFDPVPPPVVPGLAAPGLGTPGLATPGLATPGLAAPGLPTPVADTTPDAQPDAPEEPAQIVSLDAFRRRPPQRDS